MTFVFRFNKLGLPVGAELVFKHVSFDAIFQLKTNNFISDKISKYEIQMAFNTP